MNDTRRKMLTEYLGECWHEISSYPIIHNNGIKCVICKKYAKHDPSTRYGIVRRTFTTAQDMVDLVKKLEEKHDWHASLTSIYYGDKWEFSTIYLNDLSGFTVWLITEPARTCELIAEWMEAEHGR